MTILRTPDERFAALKEYPFAPHYSEVAGGTLRIHTIDEGPRDAAPVLLMHGEPSWSRGRQHVTIAGGGHFLQEDKPEEIASLLDSFICSTK